MELAHSSLASPVMELATLAACPPATEHVARVSERATAASSGRFRASERRKGFPFLFLIIYIYIF